MAIFEIFEIGNTLGFWGFTSLIILFILYLIRPKPKTIRIPSLMFLLKDRGQSRFSSFFRNIFKDILMLLQFLILIFLILTLLEPHLFADRDVSSKNTIIVLDVSASMQANGRFDRALKSAQDNTGNRNTVILAKNIPVISLEDAIHSDTVDYLKTIRPSETESAIGASILTAGEILNNREGRIIVISDFINTIGTLPETAKVVLESKGMIVDFVNVVEKVGSNVGITNLNVDADTSTIYIKNFNKEEKQITLLIDGQSKSLTLAGNSIEPFGFKTPIGITNIEIQEPDDFLVDNSIMLSAPNIDQIKVLLITNNKSFYVETVLTSIPFVQLEINEPPIISSDKYDVFIFDNINPDDILPGTMESVSEHISSGSNLIIHAQSNLEDVDYKGLLPINPKGLNTGSYVLVEQSNSLTKNIDFGKAVKIIEATNLEGAVQMASIESSPILTYQTLGDGKVMYYGIMEDYSDFKLTPYYAIFWNNMLKFLIEKDDIKKLNLESGSTIIRENDVQIKTPYDSYKANTILLDYKGLYEIDGVNIAVNLLSEKESNINQETQVGTNVDEFTAEPIKEKQKVNIEIIIILIASGLLLVELIYIKIRGDL